MSHFRCSKSLLPFLIILGMVYVARPVQAKDDEIVFEKTLPDKQKIVVLKHELEGVAKEQAQQKDRDETKLLPPNVISPMPDHFYNYLFRLSSADGKTQRELWRKPWVTYDDHPSYITVRDASYEALSATLIFVFKSDGVIMGEVIDSKARMDANHYNVPPMFLQDHQGSGVFIKSVVLGGSLAKNDLTVSATNNLAGQYTFSWKDGKWVLSDLKPPSNPEYKGYADINIPLDSSKGYGF